MKLANVLILAFKGNVESWLGGTKENLVDMCFQLQVRKNRRVEHDELRCCGFPAFAFRIEMAGEAGSGNIPPGLATWHQPWQQPWHCRTAINFAIPHFAFAVFAVTARSI